MRKLNWLLKTILLLGSADLIRAEEANNSTTVPSNNTDTAEDAAPEDEPGFDSDGLHEDIESPVRDNFFYMEFRSDGASGQHYVDMKVGAQTFAMWVTT